MAAPTNDVAFDSLTRSIREGDCIAVIGAGMSAADYPIWRDLVGMLQQRCGVRTEDTLSADPLDVAEAAKAKNQPEYFKALDEVFARKENAISAARYHLLARIKFASYVTLNFDPLLLDILGLHGNVTVSDFPHLQPQHHGHQELFFMHGRLGPDRPAATSEIVLTRTEFERAYDPYRMRLHSFIQTTFLDHNVCFLGCNPSESHLDRLVNACGRFSEATHGLRDPSRPRWFLLADEGLEAPPSLADCAIHVVRYARLDAKFAGLEEVLAYWAEKKTPRIRHPGSETSRFRSDVEPER